MGDNIEDLRELRLNKPCTTTRPSEMSSTVLDTRVLLRLLQSTGSEFL